MHFIYGFCNGIARQAVFEYQHRFPNRRIRNKRTFIKIYRQFREYGLRYYFLERGLNVSVDLHEQVLDAITRDPTISVYVELADKWSS